jgi:hypothetical protein
METLETLGIIWESSIVETMLTSVRRLRGILPVADRRDQRDKRTIGLAERGTIIGARRIAVRIDISDADASPTSTPDSASNKRPAAVIARPLDAKLRPDCGSCSQPFTR